METTTPVKQVWLRQHQVAERLGVSSAAVRLWTISGRLRCQRTPGGHRRYRREDVEEMVADLAQK
jgi:excisionase family DNA binding protein